MSELHPLVAAAIKIAADAPLRDQSTTQGRTMVKRSLVEDLRRQLDRMGHSDDWRTLHDVVRVEERRPARIPG